MTKKSGASVEQTGDDLVDSYEGPQVPCPFCRDDEGVDWQPKPFVSHGVCHECHREFGVIIRWADDQ